MSSASEIQVIPEGKKYIVFGGLAIILIAMAFYFSPSVGELFSGYFYILTHPALADFDGLVHAGHFGSAFFNSGVLLLCVLLVYKLTNTNIQGVHIAAAMQIVGFSFYGKDLLNIWFPVLGVLLHTAWKKKPLNSATALAFFSSALAPVFSVTAFGTANIESHTVQAWIAGILLGLLAGVLVSILAGHLPNLHSGYTLFNAGFAAGLVGMLIHAFRRSLNIGHDAFPYMDGDYVRGANLPLGIALSIMFGYFIIMGFIFGGGKQIGKMIWHKCKGGNFVEKFGFAPCLINMGIMGFVSVAYVLFTGVISRDVGGHLNGVVFACIWTAVGFAANGVSVRMYLPTMIGVCLTAIIVGGVSGFIAGNGFIVPAMANVSRRGMLLAAIFSCGMAPIVGAHGMRAGLLVGMAHCILVPYTAAFHGWMSLYNNGLSLSLIATLLNPIYTQMGIKKDAAAAPAPAAAK